MQFFMPMLCGAFQGKLILLALLFSLTVHSASTAQRTETDSLLHIFETSSNDSLRIEVMYNVASIYRQEDMAKALDYANQSMELAESKGYSSLEAKAANYIGILYAEIGDLEQTLYYFYKVQSYHEKNKEYENLSRVYNNVGLILKDLKRPDEAITYFKKSLELKSSSEDLSSLSITYNNIGLLYNEQFKQYHEAHWHYKRALELAKESEDQLGIFISLGSLGQNYFMKGQYDSSEYYYNAAANYMNDIDENYHIAGFLSDFARLNSAQGEYNRAVEKYNFSIRRALQGDGKVILKENYKGLADTYQAMGMLEKSMEFYKKYIIIQEEIHDADKNEKLAAIEKSYQIRTKQNEIELLRKESEILDLKLDQNTLLMYWLVGILFLVAIIVVLQYRKIKFRRQTNEILQVQNKEIVEKNNNIMNSMIYARNIQKAILPDGNKLKNVFGDAFVFTEARDVVNGDFYWFTEHENKVIVAAVDCTGHGVPAAFLNVMGNSLLNQIIHELKIMTPGKILYELNKRLLATLKSKSDAGMDVVICLFDQEAKKLTFSGAKRPLYYFSNKELKILKGDYYPVGGNLFDENREYSEHEVALQPNDSIYLFTDGAIDQFGGNNNKKFMYSRFRELLYTIQDEGMEKQHEMIKQQLQAWKGDNEQTDDILIVGVRI
ncbi:tetratricopeptide repeat protein [Fulvivirga sp. M361]|uniref:tetratricopeptide repeat protein n=1 Tax=Fulvivirga sp. M361 TaxID=2594266 RepID=UPI001179AF7A|nr:tetratricopeptide repeat protein [Fulvivirga sp. M361]TRX62609.1 tetratricopeptide repeat protein [Fulvivirga sp. M361]